MFLKLWTERQRLHYLHLHVRGCDSEVVGDSEARLCGQILVLAEPLHAKISRFLQPRHTPHHQFYAASSRLMITSKNIIIVNKMPGISLADTISQLSVEEEWGPDTATSTTLNGVPYAPYSKGDRLGRMADWTQEGKDREGRGGRQYNRNYRGRLRVYCEEYPAAKQYQINKSSAQAQHLCS